MELQRTLGRVDPLSDQVSSVFQELVCQIQAGLAQEGVQVCWIQASRHAQVVISPPQVNDHWQRQVPSKESMMAVGSFGGKESGEGQVSETLGDDASGI